MSDARELFLTLATSNDLELAIQRAVVLVSESASIRNDLGGNLGEETVGNCAAVENFLGLIQVLSCGLHAEILSSKDSDGTTATCLNLAQVICRALVQLILSENDFESQQGADFLSWRSLNFLEDVGSLLGNIFQVSNQAPSVHPVETAISCFAEIAADEDDEVSFGTYAAALSLSISLISLLQSPAAIATRKRNIIGSMSRRLFSGKHVSRHDGSLRSTATMAEVQLCLPVLGLTSQNLFDNTLARPLQFKLLSELNSTIETALALVLTLTQALSWRGAGPPLDLIEHYEHPTNIVPAVVRALSSTSPEEISHVASQLLVALLQYAAALRSGTAFFAATQVICKHICNPLKMAVQDCEPGSSCYEEGFFHVIFETLCQLGHIYSSEAADESIANDICATSERKVAGNIIRAVEAIISSDRFSLREETIDMAEQALDEWEVVYKRRGDEGVEEEGDLEDETAELAVATKPGVSAVPWKGSAAHAKILAASGANDNAEIATQKTCESKDKSSSVDVKPGETSAKASSPTQSTPGAVACAERDPVEAMKAKAFAPLLRRSSSETELNELVDACDKQGELSTFKEDKANISNDDVKYGHGGEDDFADDSCALSSRKLMSKKLPYDNDHPTQLAVAVAVNEDEEVIAYADDYDPWARVPLLKRRKCQVGLCLCFLVIITVTVAVSLTWAKKENSQTERESLLLPIFQNISGDAINDDSKPQYYAARFIANVDAQMLTPNSPNLIQRYVLSLLYTSMGGVNWIFCGGAENSSTCQYPCWADGCISSRCQATNDSSSYDGICTGKTFLDSSHECDWYGVNCTENQNVQSLYFIQNNLDGNLPSEIKELRSLQGLDLQANNLKGAIPTTIGTLSNLDVLYLNNNGFSGSVPTELFRLGSSLTDINIGSNVLRGNLSRNWGNLTSLVGIQIYNNTFTGSIPDKIFGLKKLSVLNVRENMLSGTLSNAIENLASLKSLHLESNKFQGPIPSSIGGLAYLEELALSDNGFNNSLPTEIFKITSLKFLYLENNKLSGTLPSEVGNLVSLERLILDGNSFRGTAPAEIGDMINLGAFYIENM